MSVTEEPDVLEAAARPSRTLRMIGVLVVVVLLVGGGLWAEGARRAGDERAAIGRCAESVTTAVERAERRLTAMSSYVRPAFGTAPAEVDAGLLLLVADQASLASPPVDDALATCRGVDVWRFNTEHREARAAWIAYAAAEQERLRLIAEDGGSYVSGFEAVLARRTEAERRWP